MKPLLVMNVVGLTPGLLPHTPRLAALGRAGFTASLGTLLPAVTCPVQATMLTGRPPREHGIVGNGWYDREWAEVMFWRQSNRLVGCGMKSCGTRGSDGSVMGSRRQKCSGGSTCTRRWMPR